MTAGPKPAAKPGNPCFSSGPCAKRPGWTVAALEAALVGRSHRAKEGKARLKEVIDRTRAVLNVPSDYRIGIVPAVATLSCWSLSLGCAAMFARRPGQS